MMKNNIVRPHVVMENKHNGMNAIKLTESPYSGIIISYGKVAFEEVGDSLRIKFDYEVHDTANVQYDKQELEQYLGDLLQELIIYGIHNNDLTYTGGIDENRTGDPIEPDSQ
jgi:hypothetical protein